MADANELLDSILDPATVHHSLVVPLDLPSVPYPSLSDDVGLDSPLEGQSPIINDDSLFSGPIDAALDITSQVETDFTGEQYSDLFSTLSSPAIIDLDRALTSPNGEGHFLHAPLLPRSGELSSSSSS